MGAMPGANRKHTLQEKEHAMKVGVVGLGSMGYGIAASLLRAGHEVYGADVNPDAVARLRFEGASER